MWCFQCCRECFQQLYYSIPCTSKAHTCWDIELCLPPPTQNIRRAQFILYLNFFFFNPPAASPFFFVDLCRPLDKNNPNCFKKNNLKNDCLQNTTLFFWRETIQAMTCQWRAGMASEYLNYEQASGRIALMSSHFWWRHGIVVTHCGGLADAFFDDIISHPRGWELTNNPRYVRYCHR